MRRDGRAPVYCPNSVVAGSTPADVKFAVVLTVENCTLLKALYTSAGDAQRAVAEGVSGLVVSNHGGRVLDTVPATLESLPRVVDAVADRVPVLLDGGIRRGTEVLKAIAFGARAVLIGRPYVYGLATDGAAGVAHVLALLRAELEVAMTLTGCRMLTQITGDVLWDVSLRRREIR